ncbi:hypothetical protein OM275_21950 [Escherichia albertii]|uniref:Predicted glycerol-3-phosphate cytidyltransferase n=1 Tax=Escherichia albertii TaxID=208962 RepID=A0A5A4UA39_ESCAL|nr:hypothetical protein [Escherichia albertii]MCZ8630991.1 hypothetical protein [Escherichia albertii]MCZ8635831.1 hypothetical protein [Escherichia albertii]MCZ8672877.1 hypothetical protein [Escherichia albertii]BBM62611.1 predicted glycerol-3-phosphate cytidyltransferase [Escherichia albertii]
MVLVKIKNRLIICTTKILYQSRVFYYKIKNRKKKTIFIYTDSRGYEVSSLWNKKNPFSSYVGDLMKEYYVEHHICEYSSTTIIDFLYEYYRKTTNGKKYDYVIAHVGLVDFSPRPRSMAMEIVKNKSHKINFLKWDLKLFNEHLKKEISSEVYNGESLSNLYDREFLKRKIIPLLQNIPNLIYIGCNPIISDWRGNYWQDRPKDISNILMEYNDLMLHELKGKEFVDIKNWNESDIKKYTVDNIHLNRLGYDVITLKLKQIFSGN